MELPNIAAYAYQDVHVWSALLTCLRPSFLQVEGKTDLGAACCHIVVVRKPKASSAELPHASPLCWCLSCWFH